MYYPKHAVEDIIRNPSPAVPARRLLVDARHPRLPEPSEDSIKASFKVKVSLKQKLNDDLRQALKGRDKRRSLVIRLIMSAVHNNEIAERASLDDTDIIGVIVKEAKQRRESIEAFNLGNRQDLVAQEKAELAILEEYLPEQMSRNEIIVATRKTIDEVSAQSLHDMGKVMGKLMPQLKGKADGKLVNEIVTELLG